MQTGQGSYAEYCTDLFEQSTIDRMIADFKALLQELVVRPGAKLSELAEVRRMRDSYFAKR